MILECVIEVILKTLREISHVEHLEVAVHSWLMKKEATRRHAGRLSFPVSGRPSPTVEIDHLEFVGLA